MGVCFDVLAGTLTIGGRAIPARLMPDGGLALGDDAGLVLRPLRFAERAAAVAIGSATNDTERGVAAAILAFAIVGPRAGDPAVAEIAALHLCGADAVDLPSFAATALLLGRAAGWSLSDIGEARATEIDRFVRTLAPPPAGDGWTRVRFFDGGDGAVVDGLDQVLRGMARNLLDRNDANAADSVARSTGAKLADGASRTMAPSAAARGRTPTLGMMHDGRADDASDAVVDGEFASPRNQARPMPAGPPAKPVDWHRDAASAASVSSPGPASLIASRRDAKPQAAGSGWVADIASSQRTADPEGRFRLPIRATSVSPSRQAANDVVAVALPDGARPTASGASAMLATTPAWSSEPFSKDAGADWAWATEPIARAQWTGHPAASTLVPQAQPNEPRIDAARDWDTDTLIEAIAERLHDTADLRGIDR